MWSSSQLGQAAGKARVIFKNIWQIFSKYFYIVCISTKYEGTYDAIINHKKCHFKIFHQSSVFHHIFFVKTLIKSAKVKEAFSGKFRLFSCNYKMIFFLFSLTLKRVITLLGFCTSILRILRLQHVFRPRHWTCERKAEKYGRMFNVFLYKLFKFVRFPFKHCLRPSVTIFGWREYHWLLQRQAVV